ncbi:epoxide hydrolase [Colletotrichum godetiae]|uniref:Epoxide hydrolase n=1 Tax=Colletotrichum godetiae TaxID=1209918 RepID=A0AAJ0A6L7_9PEZI|nr:epoxide hydrolase [Colletotrichum godetiae]KAK1657462.1 epoxide hydrolase [Colletotrichum godetiae]
MCVIKEFKFIVASEKVERLQRKIRDTKLPDPPVSDGGNRNYGPKYHTAAYLYDMWANDFDWNEVQKEMNEVPQFLATIEDLTIHFVHARSKDSGAIPLLAIHGWPGTFWEFSRVWGPLSDPSNPDDPAFHVVVPSMPGFCSSSSPNEDHWTLRDNARIFDKLMKSLGYTEYMVQCGDLVHAVGRELGAKYTDSCKLLHCNSALIPMPEDLKLTERERKAFRKCEDWVEGHREYAVKGKISPYTVGIASNDNPLGLLIWILERYNEGIPHPECQHDPFWTKAILTTASLYFFTECIMSSIMPHYDPPTDDSFPDLPMDEDDRIRVPFGFTSCSWDTDVVSRRAVKRAVEQNGNLVFYRGMIH